MCIFFFRVLFHLDDFLHLLHTQITSFEVSSVFLGFDCFPEARLSVCGVYTPTPLGSKSFHRLWGGVVRVDCNGVVGFLASRILHVLAEDLNGADTKCKGM